MTLFQLTLQFGLWILARDDSEDGEVYFGGINSVAAESFPFSTDRLAESFSEDGTLIFSDSNMFVWTSNTVCSVLSVLDLVNDSFSIDSSAVSWFLARDVSEGGEVTFGGINVVSSESYFPYSKISRIIFWRWYIDFLRFHIHWFSQIPICLSGCRIM